MSEQCEGCGGRCEVCGSSWCARCGHTLPRYVRDRILALRNALISIAHQSKLTKLDMRNVASTALRRPSPLLPSAALPVGILAGDSRQARTCAGICGLRPSEWFYVDDTSRLAGVENRTIWLFGTAESRRDFREISDYIRARRCNLIAAPERPLDR